MDFLAAPAWFDLGRACPASAPTTLAPVALSERLAQGPLPVPADQNVRAAWLARRVPGGWGGGVFFRGPDRDPAFYMKRPGARDSLIVALRDIPDAQVRLDLLTSAAVLQGRWDFAELYDWSQFLLPELWRPQYGVIVWDIQEAANRIEIGIDARQPALVGSVARRLRELGVPCHLVAYSLATIVSR